MPARFENKFNPTRRRLVLGVAGVLSFFGLGAGAALAAKASKASVGYRDTPKGDQNCANCILFISPNAYESTATLLGSVRAVEQRGRATWFN